MPDAIDYYAALANAPRLLMECELKPLQGDRFQATGFAHLGPARYTAPRRPKGWDKLDKDKRDPDAWEEVPMLLVESAQSVANWLEAAIWDDARDDLITELNGLPFIRVDCGELGKTNTIKESHRLNSPYIWAGEPVAATLKFRQGFVGDCGLSKAVLKKRAKKGEGGSGDSDGESVPGVLDFRKFYKAVFKYDPNAVLHGLFLEKVAGRLRMPRLLSGFIEASHVYEVASGGTKVDHVLPSPKALGLSADDGYGNVPFPRTEFTAREIKAYFNLDLALMRGYGLGDEANRLLIALALLKIRRFLGNGVGMLRTACKLEPAGDGLTAKPLRTPDGEKPFAIPTENELLNAFNGLLTQCKMNFVNPPVTPIGWKQKEKPVTVELPTGTTEPQIPANLGDEIEWVKAKGKKGPMVKFKKALNAHTAEAAKMLFPGEADIADKIDEAFAKQSAAEEEVGASNGDATDEAGNP